LLKSPDYDDARLSVMLERTRERSQALRRRQRRRKRQAVIGAVAAVILLAGGTTYGLTAGLGGAGHPARAVSTLTAVTGCPGLAAASGTLEQVDGTSLVLKTGGGKLVTVTAPASVKVSRQATTAVSEITNGTHVIVAGMGSSGRIAARRIIIGTLPTLHGPPPAHLPHRRQGHPAHHTPRRSPAQGGRAEGTVTDASVGGFTLITADFRIQVTTSGSTTVYSQTTSTVGQLQLGGFTIAVGSATSVGRLAAASIEQGDLLPRFGHAGGIIAQPWLGCSPSAVATTAFLTAG
jgi:hypothetical protein